MHAVFWMSGIKTNVDEIIKWLETRTFMLPFENPKLVPDGPKDAKGKLLKKGFFPISSQLRPSILGTWELIFPENEMDAVLTTLRFNEDIKPFSVTGKWEEAKIKAKIFALRKAMQLEKIPEFKQEKKLYMPENAMNNVRFIPIGVRYDRHGVAFKNGLVHEGI